MPCIASQRLACIARRAAQPQLSSRNCPVRAARFISAPCLPLSDSSRSSADEEHLLVGNSYSSGLATRETTAHQQAQLMPRPPPPPPVSECSHWRGSSGCVTRPHVSAAPPGRSQCDRVGRPHPRTFPLFCCRPTPPIRNASSHSRQPQPGARRARSVRGDFQRALSTSEKAPEIASGQTGRVGFRAEPERRFDAV